MTITFSTHPHRYGVKVGLERWSLSRVPRLKIPKTVYLTESQDKALRSLSKRTRVSVAALIRRGIDTVVATRNAPKPEPTSEPEGDQ